jgi:enoyl-CoA hydratase/carnithine racemase
MGNIEILREASSVTVTLSHPGKRNAIDAAMWGALTSCFAQFSADTSVRCVVVRGAAGHFAGGADISEFPELRADLAGLHRYHEDVIAPALAAIGTCPHPTIALIEGACVGGGFEIAGRCDLRLAGRSARLGVPIGRLGFPMAPAELSGLLALAGPSVTLELLLEGRLLSADEALAKNLVTRVCPDADLAGALAECVSNICAGAPLAARINKALVALLAAGARELTSEQRALAFSYHDSADHREGVAAFLERRSPRFLGR